MSTRFRGGFTLLELLVVISIIALLVAMLLPALGAAQAMARKVKCGVNARQISIAANHYASDNNEAMAPGYFRRETPIVPGFGAPDSWAHNFVRNGYITGHFGPDSTADTDTVFRCPEGIDKPNDHRDNPGYIHENSFSWGPADGGQPDWGDFMDGTDRPRVIDGMRIYLWLYLNAEHRHRQSPFDVIYGNHQVDRWKSKRWSDISLADRFVLGVEAQNALQYPSRLVARHPPFAAVHGASNVSFFDGHVEAVSTEVFDLDPVIRPIIFNLDEQ